MRHVAILAMAIQFGGRAVILEAKLTNIELWHLERFRIGGIVPAVDIVGTQLNRLDSFNLPLTQKHNHHFGKLSLFLLQKRRFCVCFLLLISLWHHHLFHKGTIYIA